MKILRALLLPLLAFLLGESVVFHSTLSSGFTRMQADPGDTRLNNYNMERGYGWLTQKPPFEHYWDPPFYYPLKNMGGTLDVQLGSLPAYALYRVIGVAPDTAFQLWMLTIAALNFFAAWLLLRRGFRFGMVASAAGAYLYAFSLPRINHLPHQQLMAGFFPVLALFALYRWMDAENDHRPGARKCFLALFFVAAVLQLYTGFYIAYFMASAVAVSLVWGLLLASWRRALLIRLKADGLPLAAGLAGAALACLPVARHYLRASSASGAGVMSLAYLPPLQAWLNPGQFSWLYGKISSVSWLGMPTGEQSLGFGLLTPALVVLGLWHLRGRPFARLVMLTSLTLMILVTRFTANFCLWRVVAAFVPGAFAIRAPGRIILLLLLPAAVGLAAATQWLVSRPGLWKAACAGVLLLVVIEQGASGQSYDKLALRQDIAAVSAVIRPDCEAFYFSPDTPRSDDFFFIYQIDAIWAAIETKVPAINGFTALIPPGLEPLQDPRALTPEDRLRIEQGLQQWAAARQLSADRVCVVRGEFPKRW